MSDARITRLRRRTAYRNRWMTVYEDDVRFPDGEESIYGVVKKPDFAAIVPIDAGGRLHLVQQFRYPVGLRLWEFPMGAWEDAPDTDPETLARAELREETGLTAGRIEALGTLFAACALIEQTCHLFLATDLVPGPPSREASESDMVTASFSFAELRELILGGEIRDAVTIAALGHLMLAGRLPPS